MPVNMSRSCARNVSCPSLMRMTMRLIARSSGKYRVRADIANSKARGYQAGWQAGFDDAYASIYIEGFNAGYAEAKDAFGSPETQDADSPEQGYELVNDEDAYALGADLLRCQANDEDEDARVSKLPIYLVTPNSGVRRGVSEDDLS